MIKIGRSDLAGEGSLRLGAPRPRIHATFRAERLDLTEFIPAPAPAPRGSRLFSRTPLALSALTKFDLAGSVKVAAFKTHGLALEQIDARADLTAGTFKLAPMSANFAGGKLDLALDLITGRTPRVEIDLRGLDIVPAKLPQFAGKGVIERGLTDFQFTLAGTGDSIAELMGNGNGRLLMKVGSALLPNAANTAGTGLLLGTLNGLNPLASKDKSTKLECAVLNFDIHNGLASSEHGLALRTDKLNVLGGGNIDLKTERIDLGAKPKPREGIGVNLAALGDFVRLGGTLSAPTPVTDTAGAATAGIKVGAALATGGLSLLAEGLFDRATSDDDVCAIAAGDELAAQQTRAAPVEKTVLGTAADTTKGAVDSVGRALKGAFRGLFGK